MRRLLMAGILCAGLSSCANLKGWMPWRDHAPPGESQQLTPADHATQLIAGGPLTLTRRVTPAEAEGEDPRVEITLRFADGRALAFEEANHAPDDLRAQAAGGALAQAMAILDPEARPTLYHAQAHEGASPLCAPEGPVNLGIYAGADGAVSIVGLKEGFAFETRADGSVEAMPVSPAIVCVRMKFRTG
jgi:hypothetical protein